MKTNKDIIIVFGLLFALSIAIQFLDNRNTDMIDSIASVDFMIDGEDSDNMEEQSFFVQGTDDVVIEAKHPSLSIANTGLDPLPPFEEIPVPPPETNELKQERKLENITKLTNQLFIHG